MTLADKISQAPQAGRSLSQQLAAHVAALRAEALPPEVVHGFRRVMVDYLACALAGAGMPVTQALLRWAARQSRTSMAPLSSAATHSPRCHGARASARAFLHWLSDSRRSVQSTGR